MLKSVMIFARPISLHIVSTSCKFVDRHCNIISMESSIFYLKCNTLRCLTIRNGPNIFTIGQAANQFDEVCHQVRSSSERKMLSFRAKSRLCTIFYHRKKKQWNTAVWTSRFKSTKFHRFAAYLKESTHRLIFFSDIL